ncbi:MAG: ABC transporter ATP-binding protein [Gammaproteobacteria bacterium]|nr:ABC transporter ATP-binding protein [Gammaproteobacteria bacterium]
MIADTLLQADAVERCYPGGYRLGPINLELRRGEIVGLLGPNGAGKSTTMAMLCGTLAPTRGRIKIADHDLAESPIKAKRCLGYLPDNPPLYLDMTVDQYLLYCARLHGVKGGQARAQLAKVKAECNLEAVGGTLISHLSKGFRQRTGIAQAIIHDPQVVILDEPTSALDPLQIEQIHTLIRQLSTTRALLLSTHILNEAEALCHRILILHKGQLHQESPTRGSTQPQFGETLLVRFNNPPTVAELNALSSTNRVESIGAESVLIHAKSADQAIAEISTAALIQGWQIREISPAGRLLERRFMEITQPPTTPGTTA